MLHNSSSLYLQKQTPPEQAKIQNNRSLLLQANDIPLPLESGGTFKIPSFLSRVSSHRFFKEVLRFLLYSVFLLILLSFYEKSHNSKIYSFISRQGHETTLSLTKQIPGVFPSLSEQWQQLLTRWNISLLSGKNGSISLKQQNYQLQFKHFDQKREDVVYITRGNCKGHVVMNWKLHGNNIYLTEFMPPKEDAMTILNEPEDEQCITKNSQLFELMKYATVWTIEQEENENLALFLLIEKQSSNNLRGNFVLVADKFQKS